MHHRYVILNVYVPKGRTLSVLLLFFLFRNVGEEIFVCGENTKRTGRGIFGRGVRSEVGGRTQGLNCLFY